MTTPDRRTATTTLGVLGTLAAVLLVAGLALPAYAGVAESVPIGTLGVVALREIETQPLLRLVVAVGGFGILLVALAAVVLAVTLVLRRTRRLLALAQLVAVLQVLATVLTTLVAIASLTSETARFVPGAFVFLVGSALYVAQVVVAARHRDARRQP